MLLNRSRKGKRVLGVDSSTNSLAFALVEGDTLLEYGQVFYKGTTIYDRLLDANLKIKDLASSVSFDKLCIEDTVTVRSANTGIKMAYFAGVAMVVLGEGKKIMPVAPMTWQNYIGNKVLTPVEKKVFKDANPGKKPSWYQNQFREIRKQRTIQWVEDKFGVRMESNDISDAVGIAWTGLNK